MVKKTVMRIVLPSSMLECCIARVGDWGAVKILSAVLQDVRMIIDTNISKVTHKNMKEEINSCISK